MWAEWLSVQPPVKGMDEGNKEELRRGEPGCLGWMPASLSCPIQFPLCLSFSENTLFEVIGNLNAQFCVFTLSLLFCRNGGSAKHRPQISLGVSEGDSCESWPDLTIACFPPGGAKPWFWLGIQLRAL